MVEYDVFERFGYVWMWAAVRRVMLYIHFMNHTVYSLKRLNAVTT